MTYRCDKSHGPTAGSETVDPRESLARVLVHIPVKGHVTTRYYGGYACRPRGMRIIACITTSAVIDQMRTHLRTSPGRFRDYSQRTGPGRPTAPSDVELPLPPAPVVLTARA